ncbi:MAG: polysaccharide pyruvyl transferase family protein [Pseudomonas sp.]
MKVLIVNHCAHNKGDNSVLYYLDKCIRSHTNRDVEIYLSSSDGEKPFWYAGKAKATCWPGGEQFKKPKDGSVKNLYLRTKSVLIRHFLFRPFLYLYSKKIDKAAKIFSKLFTSKEMTDYIVNSDYLFCSGGHHISGVLEKDCVNAQLVSLALTSLYGKKVVLWAQSIGPIDFAPKYVTDSISRILCGASNIFVRDDSSKKIVALLSERTATLSADTVFLAAILDREHIVHHDKIVCAIYSAGIKNKKYLSLYKESWAKIARSISDIGLHVEFMPMQYKGYSGDERSILKDIIVMCDDKKITYIDSDLSPLETIKVFEAARCIIGHKTHAVIYGLALNKPTIAIAYHDKTKDFMRQFSHESQVFSDVIGNEKEILNKIVNLLAPPGENNQLSLSAGKNLNSKIKEIFLMKRN